jgi:hypothetical protein
MIDNALATKISGDAQVAGPSRNRLLKLLRRSDFLGQRKNPELLPLNAADRACSNPLTKNEDEETITINLPSKIHSSRREICLNKRSHPYTNEANFDLRETVNEPRVFGVRLSYRFGKQLGNAER